MTSYLGGLALVLGIASFGCGKKAEDAGGGGAGKSGLAWTPIGYEKMSESCKKALACCEQLAASKGAKSADDFNGKCSGPALWKDSECDDDRKARAEVLAGEGAPVPDACK